MSTASEHDFDQLLNVFHEAADASGRIIRPFFRGAFSVEHKHGKGVFDPVTEADRAAEKVIRDIVLSHYPDHGFIGEEFGAIKSDSPYQWVVDPIDGTRAFISGSPLWGSLIGLCFEGKPLAGMMNQPFIDERFWGLAEEAYWQRGDAVHRLSVRETAQLAEATIMTTCPDLFATSEDFQKFESLRAKCRMTRFGGDCYSYCLLALGTIDLVVETGLQDYDIAPLVPIITAAGGLVTDWQGNEISLKSSSAADTQSSGQIIAASTKAVHEAALEVLKAAAA